MKGRVRKAPYSTFEDAVKALGLAPSALCAQLGYSPNSYHGWKEAGMPATAALACQALLYQAKPNGEANAETHKMLICLITEKVSEAEALEGLLNMSGIKFWSIQLKS
jgi:hypothetical protein